MLPDDRPRTHSQCGYVATCMVCHCHHCHLQAIRERDALVEERERIRRDAGFVEQALKDLEAGFDALNVEREQAIRERDEAREALERCRQVTNATAEAGRAGIEEARAWARYYRARFWDDDPDDDYPGSVAPAGDEPDWLKGAVK